MKKIYFLLLFISFAELRSQIMWQIEKDTVVTWYYSEGDEFNEKTINKDYWNDWYGWARTIYNNKEQQYYSKWQNHELRDGQLVLTAKKGAVTERLIDYMGDNDSIKNGKTFKGFNKRTFNYTAGMIQSKKDFLYGYYEIKFKMPPQEGYWPAFWLYGGNPNEEIDWMELKTNKKNQVHLGRHAQKYNENYLRKGLTKRVWGDWVKFKNTDLSSSYNIISGEWNQDYIKYYLNGECLAVTNLKMKEPKKLVANIAVPADNGPFKPGPPKNAPSETVEFVIDYIRVWTTTPPPKLQANRLNRPIAKEPEVASKIGLGTSRLKSKTKFMYGKKSIHKNEGIRVSLIPYDGNRYELICTGKEIPADAKYIITNLEGQELVNKKLVYGSSWINLNDFSGQVLKLRVEALNKKVSFPLN